MSKNVQQANKKMCLTLIDRLLCKSFELNIFAL